MTERASSDGDAARKELLREVVETLAALERTPCSEGERLAAEWLAERLGAVPGVRVQLEDEPSWGTFPPTATALGLLGVLAAAVQLRGGRTAGALLAAISAAGIVDEAQNGPRLVRRALRRRRSTVNVVAELPQAPARTGAPSATLVVLAHHDAPQTGVLFDQTLQRRLYELAPGLLAGARRSLPQWWIGLAGPAATIAAAIGRRRLLARAGLGFGVLASALAADVWRSATVAGANDNLSGVAALLALAHELAGEPPVGVRVLLVSCGAEETLQDGVRAFVARHAGELDRAATCFVNLDTVGSPHLVMLEGEGPVWMEDYTGPWLRDLLARCALRLEIPLERELRARASTDSVIPSRAGYPTATLLSLTAWRAPANYHLPSDVPANLDFATVADAVRLVAEVARALGRAGEPAPAAAEPLAKAVRGRGRAPVPPRARAR